MSAIASTKPEVDSLLEELRTLGATVTTRDQRPSQAEIERAQRQLGFALPSEYREFLIQYGRIAIELERTWFFYGLAEALEKTAEYEAEFDEVREDAEEGEESDGEGPYYPRRFLVLHDEGDFSNAASGTVYDADLDALFPTAGADWAERDDTIPGGFWGYLLDELSEIRDRIADPEDVLVVGSDRDLALRKQKRDAAPKTPHEVAASERLRSAVDELYAVFSRYPRQKRERYCYRGEDCEDCSANDAALNDEDLRALTRRDLFHFAYFGVNHSIEEEETIPERYAEYKHYTPRILDILDELAQKGNPSIVVRTLLKNVYAAGLSEDEQLAMERYFDALWAVLLHRSTTTPEELLLHLHAFATIGSPIDRFLAAWGAACEVEQPLRHAAQVVIEHNFDYDADGHGWDELEEDFGKLIAWLLSPDLRAAFEVARKRDPDGRIFGEALEAIEHAT